MNPEETPPSLIIVPNFLLNSLEGTPVPPETIANKSESQSIPDSRSTAHEKKNALVWVE